MFLSSDGLKVRSVQSQPIGAVSFTFNPDAGEKSVARIRLTGQRIIYLSVVFLNGSFVFRVQSGLTIQTLYLT